MADFIWRRNSNAIVGILLAILILSFITWAMGIATAVQISRALAPARATKHDLYHPASDAVLYFYAAGVPMVTALAAAVELVLYRAGFLWPVASLIWSIVVLGPWVWILLLWGTCERSADDAGQGCPNIYFDNFINDTTAERNVWYVRLTFGSLLVILAIVQISFAALVIDLERKERKSGGHVKMGHHDDTELDRLGSTA